jgi:repressor LexA
MKEELTMNQKKVLHFLRDFAGRKGFPPTLREIAFQFGLKGPKAPQKTLRILEKKGYLRRVPGGSRAVEILKNLDGDARRGRSSPESIEGPSMAGLPYGAQVVSVPILGKVRAGEPILALENIEGYITFDRNLVNSEDVFLLRVQGDSMIEAHIQDGDFALVRPQPDADNGEIVVALIDDEATVKRIFKTRDLIRLEPANPRIEPIVVKKKEKRITLVGKVIGIFRKF